MGSGGEVQRMARGWRAESLGGVVWRQAVWGLLMGLCVVAVAGDPAAMQPSSSSSSSDNGSNGSSGEVGCERPITDVIWGFGLSLVANFVANWNTTQHSEKKKLLKLTGSLAMTLFGPMVLMGNYASAFAYVPMVCHLHKMKDERMTIARVWAMLNPLSKSPARFLTACDIIMYVQKGEESHLIHHSSIWKKNIDVEDETEAMLVGEEPDEETKINQYERKQLLLYGKVALFWGEYFSLEREKLKILPKYGQLKFLRANSGFATIAIGIQAIGYIYAVIFRTVKNLRVVPLEVIGLVINFILLIGVVLYGTSNPCARPLVIYMNKEQEGKFLNVLESKKEQIFQARLRTLSNLFHGIGLFIVVLLLCISILVYFIVTLRRTTNMMIVLPLIIFAISLLSSAVVRYLDEFDKEDQYKNLNFVIIFIIILSNIVAYAWAVTVTFHYWKSQHFNTRLELINLSQFIPFIG